MTTTLPIVITEPGVYDIPDAVYHADPIPGGSLSSSGARKLLPPSCPAKFRHWADNGQAPKTAFDLGHAAHKHVLGAGAPLVVVDAADWRTKAAKEQRDQAYADGRVPLLAKDHERVIDMAAALLKHPTAAALFQPHSGKPEQSLFWTDQRTGVRCRARLDWLRHPAPGRRLIIPDYKTCDSADLEHIQRAIYNYGYHQQAAFHLDGIRALDLDADPVFLLVFQETAAPYLVTIVQPDLAALRIGRQLNHEALEVYAECDRTGVWPGYSDDIELISLPAWVESRHATKEIW